MNQGVAILVPVLGRPLRVRPLLDSIAEATPGPYRVLFIADSRDREEHKALKAAGAEVLLSDGGYPVKINAAIRATDEPLVFAGADDLRFHSDWLARAQLQMDDTNVQVVGVNDLIPRPHRPFHATHFLLTRSYCEQPTIDGKPGPFSTEYHHWRVDDEFMATAKKRGVYAYAKNAVVEHLHYMNDKAPDDPTYRLGRRWAKQDNHTFAERERLWAA